LRDQPEALGEGSRFKSRCVRDVHLITGQQQYWAARPRSW
jgi:hypothetical protein